MVDERRLFVASVCVAAVVRCVPEVAYMIAFGEASPETLQLLLTVKRVFDVLAIVPVMTWMCIVYLYSPEIEYNLKYPSSKMWVDKRIHRLKSFGLIFACAAGLAIAITLGRLFH